MQEFWILLKKEMILEWRQKYAIGGILLYVLSTVFLVYYATGLRITIESQRSLIGVWGALFWLIIMFASVNAIAKSFVQESQARQLYYYTLTNPTSVLIAKMVYNALLLLGITFLTWVVAGVILGNPIQENMRFLWTALLGSIGLSVAFTFISSIASKTRNSATLTAVLGFPVIIPILLNVTRLTRYSLDILISKNWWKDLLILGSLDVILVIVALLLFPFLWRE